MAAPVGRLSAAIATVQNENSVSLANLNFDFSLVKLEAPVEYTALGATISRRRKVDAEEGDLHRTARRLGALFEDLLPPTDELFRAYGTRVSEISSMPAINPAQSSDRDGIFASHIGADTTSIWAAVTSGSAAIAVHLLGCMLARIFTGPEAISVWVEVVQKRKEWIRGKDGAALYSNEHGPEMVAAKQDIPRADLARWDASARAWLQSADQAKARQHKQTMLILDNASVPVNNEPNTYASVIKAWTAALEALNNLVKRIPQRVQDGAALLAISSWHLYPNMAVYGDKCVQVSQKDPLFDETALLTLGLQEVRKDRKSVYWSLPLACLQYYGDPIKASRTVGKENSRIDYRQFGYIVLGCLFDDWKEFATTNEEGLQWIERLATLIESAHRRACENIKHLNWLGYLLVATRRLVDAEDSELRTAHQLINLGRRRSSFLRWVDYSSPTLFGLPLLRILLKLLEDDHQRVSLLRGVLPDLDLDDTKCIIRYISSADNCSVEYANIPAKKGNKRSLDGELKGNHRGEDIRWLVLTRDQLSLCIENRDCFENIAKTESELAEFESRPRKTPYEADEKDKLREILKIGWRLKHLEEFGAVCLPIVEGPDRYGNYSLLFASKNKFFEDAADLLHMLDNENTPGIPKTYIAGSGLAALCWVSHGRRSAPRPVALPDLAVSPAQLANAFSHQTFNQQEVIAHFCYCHAFLRDETRGLRTYAAMADIYRGLPGATVSTLVLSRPLKDSKWTRVLNSSPELCESLEHIARAERAEKDDFAERAALHEHQLFHEKGHDFHYAPLSLTLAETFACIAMFESGTCNLDPTALHEVFAMSAGNSLYIAGRLLCDPYEQPGDTEVRRVVGNIGRAGITLLISPPAVKVREADPEKWMAINHGAFDGKLEDHFGKTSIHLSFTDYEFSVDAGSDSYHIIDRPVNLVETLVSVFDGGVWVAEVDILRSINDSSTERLVCDKSKHAGSSTTDTSYPGLRKYFPLQMTSIENWDELIEAPRNTTIVVRAHRNRLARLALVAISCRKGFVPLILSEDPCWICCSKTLKESKYTENLAIIC